MRKCPCGSDSTLTVILVLALRACTKAPRNGALSGPVTVPATVAACTSEPVATATARIPTGNQVNDRMALPPVRSRRVCAKETHDVAGCQGGNASRRAAYAHLSPHSSLHLSPLAG